MWADSFEDDGKIKDVPGLLKRIFQGGVDTTVRVHVWKYLLEYYPWDSTAREREEVATGKRYNIIYMILPNIPSELAFLTHMLENCTMS